MRLAAVPKQLPPPQMARGMQHIAVCVLQLGHRIFIYFVNHYLSASLLRPDGAYSVLALKDRFRGLAVNERSVRP